MLRVFAGVAIAVLASTSATHAAADEVWQNAFPQAAAAEKSIYFEAHYFDANGTEHRQQVWRDGSRRLRRISDDRVDLSVEKDANGEYQYRLADRVRHVLVLADRTSLYRAGIFSDREGLAHGLREPRAPHEIASSGATEQTQVGPCSWSELTINEPVASTSRICWSREWAVPLLIQAKRGNGWVTEFEVSEARRIEPSDAIFQVDSAGYVKIDARADDDLAD
jgi:hypothetical protein